VSQATASKPERINLRLETQAKQRLEQAATLEGKTLSRYVLGSALIHAEEVIARHETLVLHRAEAELFFDTLAKPPAPSTRLTDLLEEHSRRVQSG
jgi:uncharacterized protein (DUF1778 family)